MSRVISGLTINRPSSDYVGLFGWTTDTTIQNIGLEGGSVSGNYDVGGLVGVDISGNGSTISDAYTVLSVNGVSEVGGLIGLDYSVGVGTGTIEHAYAAGSVTGTGFAVGGLVGHVGTLGTSMIYDVYATGSVQGDYYVGGLVGLENFSGNSTISQAYATGAVSGSEEIGGLIGYDNPGSAGSSTIEQSYATGAVNGTTNFGGLVGSNATSSTVSDSYWDIDTTGQSTGVGLNSGTFAATGENDAAMHSLATFAGWNIDDGGGTGKEWRIYDGLTTPLLRSFLTPISVTYANATKTYDGHVYSGFGVPTYSDPGATLLGSAAVAGPAATAVNAGTYAIRGGVYSDQQGYDIAYAGTLTIDPAHITVTALGGNSTYGDSPTNPGLSASGLQNGENVSVLAGLANSFGIIATTGVAGSPYTLTVTGTNTDANYVVDTTYDGSWTVDPAHITVTALGGNSTYGDSPTNPGLSASGLQNGENVSVLAGLANSFGITATTGVAGSPYTLTVTGTNTDANYVVDTTYDGSWTVDPAHITVTALGGNSTYGDSPTNPGLSASGLQNGENVSVLAGLANSFGIIATTGVAGSPYTLTVTGTNTDANYVVDTTYDGSWTVDPAHITVTALGGNSTYGDSPTNPGLSASGLQNGENVSVLAGLANSFGITATTGVAGSPYTLTVTGTNTDANYVVDTTYDGSWTVDPAHITVTALGGNSTYGDSPTNPGLSASGLQNGENVSVLAGLANSFGIIATTGVAGSPYTLTVTGTNTDANYVVDTTYDGSWTVDPAHITVTALGGNSTYGDSPTNPGLSASGLQNGENVSVLAGLANSFGITATTGVAGSPYTLTVTGTNTDANYVVDTTYDGSWTVDPAHITVTALGGNSTYGDSPTNPGLSASGLQNGENVSVLAGLANSFGIIATTGVAGSPYTLTVTGTNTDANYVVDTTYDGSWTVDPAHITVTADNESKLVGQPDPALAYQITTGSLFNGDSLTGVLTREPGEMSGIYAITKGTLAASSNYRMIFVPGVFTISPAAPQFVFEGADFSGIDNNNAGGGEQGSGGSNSNQCVDQVTCPYPGNDSIPPYIGFQASL